MEAVDTRAAIAEHAHEYPDLEVCGFVVQPFKRARLEIFRCLNTAEDKRQNFRISPEQYAIASELGEITAVYHSHPTSSPEASTADKVCSEALGIPFIIYAPLRASWSVYKPIGWKPDFVGRPYLYGVIDCFSLWRDFHADRLRLDFPDVYRPPKFWKEGNRLWETLLPVHGFSPVPKERDAFQVKENDTITFAINYRGENNSGIANHCAIYLGDGLMLHHPYERPSEVIPYVENSGYYVKHLVGIYRHISQA